MTQEEREKTVERVRKLIALAEGTPEVEEARRAREKALRLARAAGLDADDLERETFKVKASRRRPPADDVLAEAVAKAAGCTVLRDGPTYHVSGPRRAAREAHHLLEDLYSKLDQDVVMELLNWGRTRGFREKPFCSGWVRSLEHELTGSVGKRSGQAGAACMTGESEEADDADVAWYGAGRERGMRAAEEILNRRGALPEGA